MFLRFVYETRRCTICRTAQHIQPHSKTELFYQRDMHMHVACRLVLRVWQSLSVCNVGVLWSHGRAYSKKWKWMWKWLGYLHAEANPDRSILWSAVTGKCGVLQFGSIQCLAYRAISTSADLKFLLILTIAGHKHCVFYIMHMALRVCYLFFTFQTGVRQLTGVQICLMRDILSIVFKYCFFFIFILYWL